MTLGPYKKEEKEEEKLDAEETLINRKYSIINEQINKIDISEVSIYFIIVKYHWLLFIYMYLKRFGKCSSIF